MNADEVRADQTGAANVKAIAGLPALTIVQQLLENLGPDESVKFALIGRDLAVTRTHDKSYLTWYLPLELLKSDRAPDDHLANLLWRMAIDLRSAV